MLTYDKFRNEFLRDFVAKNTDASILLPDEYTIKDRFNTASERESLPPEIRELLEGAEKAWEEAPAETTHWWCFNHGRLIGKIDYGWDADDITPEERKMRQMRIVNARLREILFSKDQSQREVRLRNFRPVKPDTVTTQDPQDKVLAAYKEQTGNDDWTPKEDSAIYGNLTGTW